MKKLDRQNPVTLLAQKSALCKTQGVVRVILDELILCENPIIAAKSTSLRERFLPNVTCSFCTQPCWIRTSESPESIFVIYFASDMLWKSAYVIVYTDCKLCN